jgi:hypothetical protein
LTAVALLLCTSAVMADTGCPQVPETQGFDTSTAIQAFGTVTETDNVVNIIVNYVDDTTGPVPYPLSLTTERAEYTSSYTEDTIADQGLVSYTKSMTTDTAGMATTNLYNVQTSKVVEFIGADTGRMTSVENTVVDGAGTAFTDSDILICPFAGQSSGLNPAFCNIVQEGSSVDLTLGSLTTGTEQRYIMKSDHKFGLDYPVSDPGVESNYHIKLTGFGNVPAMGSADAYIDVHVQEARGFTPVTGLGQDLSANPKAEDLVYSETTTASGDITLFEKVMSYNSKITAPGQLIINR